eukprot:374743-Rhodomonas_salina.1
MNTPSVLSSPGIGHAAILLRTACAMCGRPYAMPGSEIGYAATRSTITWLPQTLQVQPLSPSPVSYTHLTLPTICSV